MTRRTDSETALASGGRPGLARAAPGARRGADLLLPLAVGLGLGLLALGPGLRRGFLLSYDMVAVPRQPFGAAMFGLSGGPPRAVPSDAVLAGASLVLPADLAQKALLLAIFMLACAGAAALLPREPWFARLAAGIFYTWNPFVAERLIIGQWALLLGYAGLPWVLRAAGMPGLSWRWASRLGLALLPAAAGGFAAMAISGLVAVPAAALGQAGMAGRRLGSVPESLADQGAGHPRQAGQAEQEPIAELSATTATLPAGIRGPASRLEALRPALGAAAAALAVTGVASLPWLIPALLRPVYADPAGVAAFAARADTPFGSAGSLLMLGGLWNARAVPAGYGGGWSVLWLAVVLTGLAGFVLLARRPARWPGLGLAALAGLVIAGLGLTGAGQDLLRAAQALWPGFAVLRDGQQFAAPLALAGALGAGLAAAWLARTPAGSPVDVPLSPGEQPGGTSTGSEPRRCDIDRPRGGPDRAGWVLAVALVLAPVLLLPGLAWGAAGRLRPAWYPAGWLHAAQLIDRSPAAGSVLVLPWASYRSPGWNGGRTMLDPWPRLVARPVIWNDGPQVGPVMLRPDDPAARSLDGIIRSGGPLTAALRAAGVRYVVSDGGGGVAGRLPGAAILTASPGLAVYLLPGSLGK